MIPSKYEMQTRLMPSLMDINTELNANGALALFQDITSVHSEQMGVDNPVMARRSNAYWAISRSKIRFYSHPRIFDPMKLVTWPVKPRFVRFDRNYLIYSGDGEDRLIAEGCSEWVILDRDTHGIRKLETTCYPEMDYCPDVTSLPPYTRFRADLGDEDYVYTKKILSSSIDASNHTNNVKYSEILLDALPVKFFRENRIRDFDIRFVSESREGDELRVYARTDGNTATLACRKENGAPVAEAYIVFIPITGA